MKLEEYDSDSALWFKVNEFQALEELIEKARQVMVSKQ